jgi:hypothetical protein
MKEDLLPVEEVEVARRNLNFPDGNADALSIDCISAPARHWTFRIAASGISRDELGRAGNVKNMLLSRPIWIVAP